jgi:hypothetical protein
MPLRSKSSKYDVDNLILNPCLKDLAFYTQVNVTQAFQKIEQFVSNQLVDVDTPDVPVGSDDDIRDSKGFDKWTFRKQSNKQK